MKGVHMARTSTWFGSFVRASVVMAAMFGVLLWTAGSPAHCWRGLSSGIGASGDAGFEQLLVSVTALAAWLALGWFCTVTGLAFAGAAPGVVGRLCAKTSKRLTPHVARRLVEAVVGISILAGPLSATSAFAASAAPTPAASGAPNGGSSGSWTSSLDRPTSQIAPAPAARLPLYLDRPANPYVAPEPSPTAVVTPAGSAALIAGSPIRGVHADPDSGYVVRRGDALWDIAARHLGASATAADIAREWPRWYQANRAVIGSDPALIRPGELLVPP
jgi:resuscitation-promoting factor RpfA